MDPNRGGEAAGLFARDFAMELSRQKNNVYVLTPERPGPAADDEGINITRFKCIKKGGGLSSLKIYNPRDIVILFSIIINGWRALTKLNQREKFDVLICMWAIPAGFWGYLASRFYSIPYVTWSLGSDIWNYGRKPLTKWLIRMILKGSLKVYADGISLSEETQKIGGRQCEFLPTTRVLPGPVLQDLKSPFDKTKKNFLFVGRYHFSKGADLLLEAARLLPHDIAVQCHFHLYGGGEDQELLNKRKNEYQIKNMDIHGYAGAEEVSSLMNTADFLIIPSRFDSIPVVFSEALQMKLPMIVADAGDLKNLVIKYSLGFYFEKENAGQLAERIIQAMPIDKKYYENNFAEALKIFDIKASVLKLLNDIGSGS